MKSQGGAESPSHIGVRMLGRAGKKPAQGQREASAGQLGQIWTMFLYPISTLWGLHFFFYKMGHLPGWEQGLHSMTCEKVFWV